MGGRGVTIDEGRQKGDCPSEGDRKIEEAAGFIFHAHPFTVMSLSGSAD